jgi:4-carboxymuconolactone decarboxylase
MVSEARNLLRHLAASDEDSLRMVLVPTPEFGDWVNAPTPGALDRRTRALVRLAALFAVDACTESLRWAADLASATGVGDDAVVAALVAAGSAAGSAQLAAGAARLALALGFEIEPEGAGDLAAPWLLTE